MFSAALNCGTRASSWWTKAIPRSCEDLEGSFEGIGATVEMRDGRLTVVAPIDGSPAEKAGLKSGDVITKMAGKKVLNIYDYMGILGELKSGDVVEVEVLRAGTPLTVKATMERRK